MYVTNITDSDTISMSNFCTNNDTSNEIIIPLITIIPCGMSLMCLISLMVYLLIKHLFDKK